MKVYKHYKSWHCNLRGFFLEDELWDEKDHRIGFVKGCRTRIIPWRSTVFAKMLDQDVRIETNRKACHVLRNGKSVPVEAAMPKFFPFIPCGEYKIKFEGRHVALWSPRGSAQPFRGSSGLVLAPMNIDKKVLGEYVYYQKIDQSATSRPMFSHEAIEMIEDRNMLVLIAFCFLIKLANESSSAYTA
jgi:hypothetical protein